MKGLSGFAATAEKDITRAMVQRFAEEFS